ncbi:cytochrome P450 [Obba rivulosa]|uniref:Cytochrome P450 n=1 Tax=Obba rivulosa TaxID=1052685 RepID=A0A8E2DJA0_9APHY|nr:cytochrome P450 [Obba rivulosa]
MNLLIKVFLPLVVAGLLGAFGKLVQILIRPYFSSLRHLPGPPRGGLFYGNLKSVFAGDNSAVHEAWLEKYGHVIKYKGFFNKDRLYTTDLKAVNHFLTHSSDYQKPALARFFLSKMLGEGLLIAEGESHRKQRRVLNPAFGPGQIRELTSIFIDQARELCSFWDAKISTLGEPARINVLDGLSKTTLNIIGLAGFNYYFDALNPDKKNELSEAFSVIFSGAEDGLSFWDILISLFPPLRLIPNTEVRRLEQAKASMRRIGLQLVAEKKASVMRAHANEKSGSIEMKDVHDRDLLTLLIKANMASDLPETVRLSDEDVLWQVPTFLVAGHETTSSATTWCLFALTQAPEVQQKLREELFTIATDTPTMDELNSLHYLDAVMRETLRLYAPVAQTTKEAKKDDVVPLSVPFTDTCGEVHDSIKIDKGTQFFLPLLVINRSKALWGEDALEFKPERWESLPEAVSSIPGVWSNLLTFTGGPRSCIGYRFTLVEMKALLFMLVRSFEFELAVPYEDITRKQQVVQRPLVKSEMEKGSQMPLLLKRYQRI